MKIFHLIKIHLVPILLLALSFFWGSVFLSYRPIADASRPEIFATGGFPLSTFEYPIPPLGAGVPWGLVLLPMGVNFVFCFLVSVCALLVLPINFLEKRHWYMPLLIIVSLAMTFIGLIYLVLKFD